VAAARVLGLTVGLCHGPGCRREQTVPFWCSERCQEAWDARWGKRLPDDWRTLPDAFTTAPAFTTAGGYTVPAPRPVFTMDELAHYYRLLEPPEPPESVKLTREQFEELRAASPTYPDYAQRSTFGDVPVVLVDSLEDSTPYLHELARFSRAVEANRLLVSTGAEFPQVAPENPQVARGWLGRWLGRMFGKDHT
jgi:hypothetical protein